jgi:hypothetical protein
VHGVIFTSFRDYLSATHGSATSTAVFESEPEYLLNESYPDEDLRRLVALTSARTGREPDEILFEFGVFTAEITFARLYPAFFDVSVSTREFLLTVRRGSTSSCARRSRTPGRPSSTSHRSETTASRSCTSRRGKCAFSCGG